MLYQIYDLQRNLFVQPLSDFALAASKAYTNSVSPLRQLPMADQAAAYLNLLHHLGKDYVKPEFDLHSVLVENQEVAIQEKVEIAKPFCRLLCFKRFSDSEENLRTLNKQPAVLIIAPLSGHHATLLRDTVRTMLQGHQVYITDWENARNIPLSSGDFHLDDYVNYVQEFIRHIQQKHGTCHTMSVCQPTVPVLAAVSLMASRGETTPLSMIMMGGPIDARKSPTQVNSLANQHSLSWFEDYVTSRVPSGFEGAGRRVYPGFMQHTGFVFMNASRHASSHYEYFQNLVQGDMDSVDSHRRFYDEYNAVMDMDAHFYLETIATVFQEYKLMRGTWDVKNPQGKKERVKPQDIRTTALLTVEGELDDISGSGQTRAAIDLCSSIKSKNKTHFEVKGAGHYGIFSGTRWREKVYPEIRQVILQNQEKWQKSQATPGTAAKATPKKIIANQPPAVKTPVSRSKAKTKTSATTTSLKAATVAKAKSSPAKKKSASPAPNARKKTA